LIPISDTSSSHIQRKIWKGFGEGKDRQKREKSASSIVPYHGAYDRHRPGFNTTRLPLSTKEQSSPDSERGSKREGKGIVSGGRDERAFLKRLIPFGYWAVSGKPVKRTKWGGFRGKGKEAGRDNIQHDRIRAGPTPLSGGPLGKDYIAREKKKDLGGRYLRKSSHGA